MAKTREDLQNLLEELHGSEHVYFQPPETMKIVYPAIIYKLTDIKATFANNARYINRDCYEIVVVSPSFGDSVIRKLLSLPYCDYVREYKSDNLYHDVLYLYY